MIRDSNFLFQFPILYVDNYFYSKTLRVEPGMSMGRLSSILIAMGWTLPVVPELNQLTVGNKLERSWFRNYTTDYKVKSN